MTLHVIIITVLYMTQYNIYNFMVVQSRYAGGAVKVRSWCGRGTLVVRSRYARGTLVVQSRNARGAVERSRYARGTVLVRSRYARGALPVRCVSLTFQRAILYVHTYIVCFEV